MPHCKKTLATVAMAAMLVIATAARADDIPDIVAAQARALEASGAAITVSRGWPDVLHEYAANFLQAFLRQDVDPHTPSALDREARAAGQAWRRAHPEQVDAILHGYGYTHVIADGTWSFGWEMSHFVPDGIGRETWYVDSMTGASWAQLGWVGPLPGGSRGARTHVEGWLARSTGRAVSMGGDARLLMATAVTRGLPDLCIGALSIDGAAPLTDATCP